MTRHSKTAVPMQIATTAETPLITELDLLAQMLPLAQPGLEVLELGCGDAAKTRAIAKRFGSIRIEAAEVDRLALEDNRAAQPTWENASNIHFVDYGAQAIAKNDASVDLVLMFKSLHHVPAAALAKAMSEIHRVLKPGGLAYVSEPVFAGELNEVIRLFHDEREVRELAFAAITEAVNGGLLELVEQRFFRSPVVFQNFQQFANGIIHATHSTHHLSAELLAQVEAKFDCYAGANGFRFDTPNRVDLLRRPR